MSLQVSVWYLLFFCVNKIYSEDRPCAARQIKDHSVVCVCNSTYCDDIVREEPQNGLFMTYTSSESGARFVKTQGHIEDYIQGCKFGCKITELQVDPNVRYQKIIGFGGAVTDAASMNWVDLKDPQLMQNLIDSYYSKNGLEYNMARVPIGGTDFSTHPYAYNELPVNDTYLTNFTLTTEDIDYKIPMIKAIMNVGTAPLNVVATTWSPPPWMKSNNHYTGFSQLKPDYYDTYALYHSRFIESYENQRIPIWAITTTNEPVNGVLFRTGFNSLGWSAKHMGKWIANNLGPLIHSKHKNVKILAVDDQRALIPYFFNLMVNEDMKALQYIDGVAVHYYTDFVVPASVFDLISHGYPDKFIIATEACEGSIPFHQHRPVLGSWDRAVRYIKDIITDLNHNLVGWIDWNLCLNEKGGPNWVSNFVDSPIIVFPDAKEFVKQPMFYALGHVSKFIPRGSQRIHTSESKSWFSRSIDNMAFITPNNDTVVVVLCNNDKHERSVRIILEDKQAELVLAPRSFATIELPYTMNSQT